MPQYKHGITVVDTEVVQVHGGFFFCWIASVITKMSRRHQNSDWSNLKILMSGWYRKLTSSCVSFTIYQHCNGNIKGNFTPTSLQYQNVHWDSSKFWGLIVHHIILGLKYNLNFLKGSFISRSLFSTSEGLFGAIFWGHFSVGINTFTARGFSETRPFMHLGKRVFRSQ